MAEAEFDDPSSTVAGLARPSSRTPGQLRAALDAWLGSTMPAGAEPHVLSVSGTAANGQSSETVLFEAEWADAGERRHERLVARLAPVATDVPVFPAYDLGRQYDTIGAVAQRSPVPVPRLYWYEPDARPLGSPFFVMGHVDGHIPPDLMPYTFGDNWLADATDDDRSILQRSVVRILADLHAIDDAEAVFAGLRPAGPGDTALARRVAQARSWYEFAARDCGRSPLVERAFAWLDGRWPGDPGPTVLSWGDARIGNVIFEGMRPAAVLDWEMATLGPRELDLAWLIYSHRLYQDFADQVERPGLPGFLRKDDVAGTYARMTGHDLRDLEPYLAFAAVQWAIVLLRVGTRRVHFGDAALPGEVDEFLHNRDSLEAILAGTYWS
jgi:aminoglycoside phosphotransferase (APT) family kinase protein